MIIVNFNKPDFEYDVHSLLKAFFPNEDIQMYYTCDPSEFGHENVACTSHEKKSDEEIDLAGVTHIFDIDYINNEIKIMWDNFGAKEVENDKQELKFEVETASL